MFLRLLTRAPRTSIASWVIADCDARPHRRENRVSRKPHMLTPGGGTVSLPMGGARWHLALLSLATATQFRSSERVVASELAAIIQAAIHLTGRNTMRSLVMNSSKLVLLVALLLAAAGFA